MNLFKKLDDISVKTKLIGGFGIILSLMLILVVITLIELSILEEAEHTMEATDHITIYELQARRNEKDFLIRKDMKYVDKHKKSIEEMLKYNGLVMKHKWSKEQKEKIMSLEQHIKNYGRLFNEVVELEIKKGLNEKEGLRGSFRGATKDVETKIKERGLPAEVTAQMLMCRRREKDYIIRGDDAYVGKLEKDVNTLLSLLEANGASDLSGLVGKYHKGFLEMVKANDMIKEKIAEFRGEIHSLEPILDKVEDDVALELKKTSTMIHITIYTISAIALSLSVIIAIILIKTITEPISKIISITERIAENDLTTDIAIDRSDEFGTLLKHFSHMVVSLREIIGSIATNASHTSDSSQRLAATSEELAATTEEVSAQSTTVSSATEESSANVTNMSEAANNMSMNVTTVATAIEQMNASLNEVAKNCQKESDIATKADDRAKGIQKEMDELGDSAQQISKVVEVINDIADQTNLLALNATIEAASAGEAGKGFAVVANEIKELAKQTAQATDEISTQIDTMQNVTKRSIDSIGNITSIITEINTISHTIVSAVEEQSATIGEIASSMNSASSSAEEIARSVSETSTGLTEVASNIAGVNDAMASSTEGVNNVSSMAEQLSASAEELHGIVQKFKI